MAHPGGVTRSRPHNTGRRPRHAAERAVFVRYLQAVINVYGPWTTSQVVSDRERRMARDRVAKARDLLDRFTDPAHRPATTETTGDDATPT
jgi:hypothetical protein